MYKINKKGFTLVEVLGVIVILAAIAAISYPTINNSIKKSKANEKKDLIKNIEIAGKSYSNIEEVNSDIITFQDLLNNGFIKTITDPTTGDVLVGCLVKESFADGTYSYKYDDNSTGNCDNTSG